MKLKTFCKIGIVIGLLGLFVNTNAQIKTWTYQPDATDGIDNTMLGGDRDTMNCGITPEISIGYFDDNSEEHRILIKFTPIDVPSNATIISAYLTMTFDSKAGTPPTTCYVYSLRRADWVEGTQNVAVGVSNWNQYKTDNNWTTAGATDGNQDVWGAGAIFDSTTGLTWSGTDNIDITNCITKTVGKDGVRANNGFRISGNVTSGNNYGWWKSSDDGTAAIRPKITINYTLPGIIPRVYKSEIQSKVEKGVMMIKVRSSN